METMDTIELKPCPFCGSSRISVRGATIFYVVCLDCEASTNIAHEKQRAIDYWNRRKNSDRA